MRPGFVLHIASKEILSTLRDRRAILSNLLIPLLVLPFVMLGLPLVLGGVMQREGETVSELAVSGLENAPAELVTLIEAQNAVLTEVADPFEAVRSGDYQAGFSVPENFAERLEAGEGVPMSVYSRRGNMRSELNATKVTSAVRLYGQSLVAERLAAAGLDPAILEPVSVQAVDASTEAERATGLLSWLIPFFIAIWTLVGGQMTAIDATAGERERGTLEVLLVAPVRRAEVVVGKFLATMASGLTAAFMAIVGFLVGGLVLRGFVAGNTELADVADVMGGQVSADPVVFGLLVLLAVMLSALTASLLISITTFAKSFKEAQSYVAPLSFVIIIPIFALQFADFLDFGPVIYLVPVLNVMLSMDEAIKGSAGGLTLALALGSSALYAGLLLLLAYGSFRREDVLFRS